MSVVDNAIYVDGRRKLAPPSLDTAFSALRSCPDDGRSFAWIGMLRPGPDEIHAVAHEFDLHELAVEDTVNQHQRPKLERYGDTTFVVLRPARYVDPVEVIKLGELHLFLGPEFAITVRHADEPDLAVVRKCLEDDPELLAHGPYAVLWGVLDRVVDDYLPVLQGLQDDIDQIEEQVFGGDAGGVEADLPADPRGHRLPPRRRTAARHLRPDALAVRQERRAHRRRAAQADARRRGPRHAGAGARRELPDSADQPRSTCRPRSSRSGRTTRWHGSPRRASSRTSRSSGSRRGRRSPSRRRWSPGSTA